MAGALPADVVHTGPVGSREHEPGAVEQGAPDLEDGGVHVERGELEDGVVGGQPGLGGVRQREDGVVRDLDALGRAGAAGGVDDVGGPPGLGNVRRALARVEIEVRVRGRCVLVDGQDRHCGGQEGAQPRGVLPGGEDGAQVVAEDEGADPLVRRAGVQRQVRAPGQHRPQQGGDGAGRAPGADPDALAGGGPAGEAVGGGRGPGGEFAVADPEVAVDQGGAVGVGPGHGGEGRAERGGGGGVHGAEVTSCGSRSRASTTLAVSKRSR